MGNFVKVPAEGWPSKPRCILHALQSGVTQAERLLEEYHQNGDSVDFVFGKEHYF